MKKLIIPIALVAFMGLSFTACGYEDDTSELTVYLTGESLSSDKINDYVQKLDAAEALVKAHEKEAEAYVWNSNNPDYRFGELEPDYYISTKEGYVGVVDLGLSKKWACVNMGGKIPQQRPKLSLKDYFNVHFKPDPRKIPTTLVMSYKEYVKGNFYNASATIDSIEKYIVGAESYANEYAKYASGYYASANMKYFFATGGFDGYVIWGYPEMWKPNQKTVASLSLRPEWDAATQLWGEEWATPSRADLEELVKKCRWEYLAFNGQEGAEVIGPNGKAIWLPLVGAKATDGKILNGNTGYYLSSEKEGNETLLHAYVLCCSSKNGLVRTQPGDLGYCLRPVVRKGY